MCFGGDHDRVGVIAAEHGRGAIAVVIGGGVAAVDRDGHPCGVARPVGGRDRLRAFGRGEEIAPVGIGQKRRVADRYGGQRRVADGEGLCRAVDRAIRQPGDDGRGRVKDQPVGGQVTEQIGAVGQLGINDHPALRREADRAGVGQEGHLRQFVLGQRRVGQQVGDLYRIAAVILGRDRDLLRIAEEQAEGDLMEEFAPCVFTDPDLAGRALAILPLRREGNARYRVVFGQIGIGRALADGRVAAAPADERPAVLRWGRNGFDHLVRPQQIRPVGDCRAAVRVKFDGVALGRPNGIKRDRCVRVVDAVERIGRLSAVDHRPAGLRAAFAGEGCVAQDERLADLFLVDDRVALAVRARPIGDRVGDDGQLQLVFRMIAGIIPCLVGREEAGAVGRISGAEHDRGIHGRSDRGGDADLRAVRHRSGDGQRFAGGEIDVVRAAGGGVIFDDRSAADVQLAGIAAVDIDPAAGFGGVVFDPAAGEVADRAGAVDIHAAAAAGGGVAGDHAAGHLQHRRFAVEIDRAAVDGGVAGDAAAGQHKGRVFAVDVHGAAFFDGCIVRDLAARHGRGHAVVQIDRAAVLCGRVAGQLRAGKQDRSAGDVDHAAVAAGRLVAADLAAVQFDRAAAGGIEHAAVTGRVIGDHTAEHPECAALFVRAVEKHRAAGLIAVVAGDLAAGHREHAAAVVQRDGAAAALAVDLTAGDLAAEKLQRALVQIDARAAPALGRALERAAARTVADDQTAAGFDLDLGRAVAGQGAPGQAQVQRRAVDNEVAA